MNISSDEQFKPWYISDIKHRYTRRADWHDYSSRCHYMVTFNRNCNYGKPLSRILHAGKTDDGKLNAIASLSKTGMIIHKWIYQAEQTFRVMEIINSVIMPDHVHIVIFFREKADYTLGQVINYIKRKATSELKQTDPEFSSLGISLFEKSFHDRIVFREGVLKRLVTYVADNPRRYLMRTLHKDLFHRHHILVKGNLRLVAFGNIHLLKDPCRSPLIVSSRYTLEEKARYEAEWEATAAVRGVFVSPFISPQEKLLARQFLDRGARIIKIVEHGFWGRFKPSGELFDLCTSGRLLLIGETDDNIRNMDMTRNLALKLNDRAREIAYNDPFIQALAYGDEDGWRLRRPFDG